MPGYVIHLAEAKLIVDKLEKTMSNIKLKVTWREEFYYGALLPDAIEKSKKGLSHFWNKKDVKCITMVPDLDAFCKKYVGKRDDPVYWGYLLHLQLDRLFWEKFMKKNVEFIDKDGKETELLENVAGVKLKKNGKIIGVKEFFSEEYLYGDYTKLNDEFIRNYDLIVPSYKDAIENVIEEADYKEMKNTLNKLKLFIGENKIADGQTKVIHFKEMNEFLKETAEQFINNYGREMVYEQK